MIASFKKSLIKCTIFIVSLTLMIGCSKVVAPSKNTTDIKQDQNEVPKSSTDKASTEGNSSTGSGNIANTNSPVVNDSQKKILGSILKLAKDGKIINCEFGDKTTVIEDVEKKWGKADKTDWVASAKGNYATYLKKNVVFGFNKGSQIFEVRSLDKELGKISMAMVKEFFGTPAYDVKTNGQEIVGYIAGQDYKILFVFPQVSTSGTKQFMDHYSVLYPKGTVNNMADDPGRKW